MILRDLVASFGLDFDKSSFKRADNAMSKLKRGAVALAGVLVANRAVQGIRRMVSETAALGDSVDKTASKLGIETGALQELRHAAELTGVPLRTMDMALQRFTRRAAEAAQGTGEAKAVLEELGIELKDDEGNLRATEDLLGDVAEKMRGMTSDGDRLRVAFKLFDSEGAALVNTLKGGRGALEEMRKEARDLGGVMDAELIASSVEFTDSNLRLKSAIQGVKNVIAKALLPAMNKTIKSTIDWLRANRDVIATRFERWIKIGVTILGLFATTLGTVVGLISDMVDILPEWAKQIAVILGIGLALAAVFGAPVFLVMALIGILGILIQDLQAADGVFGTIVQGFLEEVERLGEAEAIGNIFTTAIKFWKKDVLAFLDWLREVFFTSIGLDIINRLTEEDRAGNLRLKKQLEGPKTAEVAAELGFKRTLFPDPPSGGVRRDRLTAGSIPAGGTQSVVINQTINSQPGMDEGALADAVAKKTEGVLQREARHTQRALVPSSVPAELLDPGF